MASIGVVTDSAADLDPELAAAREVRVVPLTVSFDGQHFLDQVELSTSEFWSRCKSGSVPSTAAPSIGAFREGFLDAAAGKDGVLCVTLASKLSATYQAACAAAELVRDEVPVRVVDSMSVSLGQALAVIAACDLAASGAPLEQLATDIRARVADIRLVGVLDTLDFLRRGGRIGGVRALMGQMLSVKPVIEIKAGQVDLLSRQRTRRRSLAALFSEASQHDVAVGISLVHAAAADIEDVLSALAEHGLPDPRMVRQFGAVIGSHVGPGAVGLAFAVPSATPGASRHTGPV